MSIKRSTIRRLQQALRGNLESFELLDGTRFYYNPQEVHKQLFLAAYDLALGKEPEPPAIYQKICEAKDPAAVLERLKPESPEAFVNVAEMYDRHVLVNERHLVPNVGQEPEDLSEGA